MGHLVANGYHLEFEDGNCRIIDASGSQLIVVKHNRNNLFLVKFSQIGQANAVVSSEEESLLWHKRYGYLNFQGL